MSSRNLSESTTQTSLMGEVCPFVDSPLPYVNPVAPPQSRVLIYSNNGTGRLVVDYGIMSETVRRRLCLDLFERGVAFVVLPDWSHPHNHGAMFKQ